MTAELSPEEKHNLHQNKVYLRIRANLPGDFEQFSSESLSEMIFNVDKGFTALMLREDLVEKFKASPRDFMIGMLEEVKKKCDEVLHLLECKKCGIDLPVEEDSA